MRTVRRIAAIAALVVLAACDQGGDQYVARVPVATPTISNSRVVALVGTMTGSNAEQGNDAYTGADAAIAVLNRALGERDRPFELVTLDDAGDPNQAQTQIEELLTKYSTVGLLYAGPPQSLAASEDVLAQVGVPALLQTGDLSSQELLTAHIFQMAPPYLWQANEIMSYVFADRGYRRVGALTSESVSGQSARRSLNLAVAQRQKRLVSNVVLSSDGSNLTEALATLRKKRTQAIVVEGGPGELEAILKALNSADATYVDRRTAKSGRGWHPQVLGFDGLISPTAARGHPATGTVAVDTYARGAHYLPIPSFGEFRRAFDDWWGNRVPPPLGQERRAFESVLMIGWAANQIPSSSDADLAKILESVHGRRFGGLDVTFGSSDHLATDEASVGLWTVPSSADNIPRDAHPPALPWVPLDRAWTTDGRHTSVARADWPYLFGDAAGSKRPPLYRECRYGIRTKRTDPIH